MSNCKKEILGIRSEVSMYVLTTVFKTDKYKTKLILADLKKMFNKYYYKWYIFT